MIQLDQFRNFLKDKSLKLTRERIEILKEISSLKTHFDIDGLSTILQGKKSKVSRASLYRTIPLLVESGLVEEIKTIDRHTYYEYVYGKRHHDHLICMKCGKIIEFYSEKLERLQDHICAKEQFRGVRHLLEIQGYCKKCL